VGGGGVVMSVCDVGGGGCGWGGWGVVWVCCGDLWGSGRAATNLRRGGSKKDQECMEKQWGSRAQNHNTGSPQTATNNRQKVLSRAGRVRRNMKSKEVVFEKVNIYAK